VFVGVSVGDDVEVDDGVVVPPGPVVAGVLVPGPLVPGVVVPGPPDVEVDVEVGPPPPLGLTMGEKGSFPPSGTPDGGGVRGVTGGVDGATDGGAVVPIGPVVNGPLVAPEDTVPSPPLGFSRRK